MMLFDDGDAALLKKWIVKRLEDISDADSDVLADYVLALLRHDQQDDEVKKLCIEQLDDFLREHTEQFVNDVFLALKTKSFISVNSTLAGSAGVSVIPPTPTPPAPLPEREPSQGLDYRKDRDDREARGQKRSYFDRDRDGGRSQDSHYGQASSGRGFKAPRRGGAAGPGKWARADAGVARGGFPHQSPHQQQPPVENHFVPPPGPPPPMPFGLPQMPPPPGFPWAVPNPNDPMAAFLAAQAAAWGFPPVMGGLPVVKPGEEKKVVKKVGERCKDYDEKGFCMKGDMCPYEHGMDHIVVPGQEGAAADEYDPNNSQLFTPNDSKNQNDRPPRQERPSRGGRGGQRGGRGGRSEISGMGPSYDRSNMTLVVEHIPDDKLTESAIKEFFTSFGTVTTVEVQPNKRLATVTFERWTQAKKAYDSPAPIFDNRFVKVFWYKSEAGGAVNPNGNTAKHTLSGSVEPVDFRSNLNDDEEIDMEEFKQRQEEAQKAYEAKMTRKKANEEAAKELEKRKEELLKQQMEEKRKLMEKLAKKMAGKSTAASASPPPKVEKGAMSASPPASNGEVVQPKDAAMTAALKAQLEALEAEARALGIEGNTGEEFDLAGFRGRGRGRGRFTPRGGRGGYVPRGRGAPYIPYGAPYRGRGGFQAARGRGGTLKLDNRPRKVAITAPDLKGEKDEDFRHYLMNTGLEVEGIEPHPEKEDTQIITFKDRRSAEQFVFTGSEIPNVGTVALSWYSAPGGNTPATFIKSENDVLDAKMEGGDESHHHHHHGAAAAGGDHRMDDDSYDLAEDDEGRWLPE